MLASMINGSLTDRCSRINCTLWAFVSYISISASTLLTFSLLTVPVMAQEDTLSAKAGTETVREDSLSEKTGAEVPREDSLSEKTGAEVPREDSLPEKADVEAIQLDHLPEKAVIEKAQKDSVQEKAVIETAKEDSPPKKAGIVKSELVNIAKGNRRVRAYGWGEYRVGGRCLCCDNKNDGDCIVVHTIERTNRERISQIIDGKIEGDTSNKITYFGDLMKRELPEYVTNIMVDISLGKMYEISKVIVYTMIDNEKRANFLSNCEFGYYDQFNRLQWTGKVESKKYDEPIPFEMENPVLTKKIMLRVKGGKNRITEVAVFSRSKKE